MADGVEVGRAHVTVTADGRPAVKQVASDFDRGMPEVGKKAGGHLGGGIFAAASKFAAPLAAAFAGGKIAGFLGDSVSAASDLNEAGTKTEAIFGKKVTDSLNRFAANAATKLGQTKLQYLDAAATFGTFGKAAGLSGIELQRFSAGFVGLSSDLASFFNTSPDEAMEAITAGLRGEAEPLRKYGVLLDDATLRQEALAQGLVKTTKQALTPQQKVLAAQAVIYKQTQDAQGDFARTSGGLANQQRILAAQFDSLKGKIGAQLLPVVLKVVTFFNNNLGPAATFVATAFRRVQSFLAPLASRLSAFVGQGSAASGFLRGSFLPALQGVAAAGRRLGAVILPIIRQVAAGFLAKWPVIKPLVQGIFSSVRSIVVDVMGIVRKVISSVTNIITLIWSRFGGRITGLVTGAFTTVLRIVGGVLKVVQGVVKTVLGLITGNWKQAGEGIKLIVRGLGTVLINIFRNLPLVRVVKALLDTVRGAFSRGVDAIGAAWDRLKEKAKAPIRFVVNTVINSGLIAAFNKIARIIPGVGELPNVSVGFHAGGWTGPGSKYQPAGIVHADEFVINKASRRRIEAEAPGLLDQLNGYAAGGLVGGSGRFSSLFASRVLAAQKMAGVRFNIFQRGFRPATSYSGTSHRGDAIDTGPVISKVVRALRQVGIAAWDRTGKGNWAPHIHGVPLPGAGFAGGSGIWQAQDYLRGGDGLGGRDNGPRVSVIGKIGEFLKAGFSSFVDWFKNLVKDPLAKLGSLTSSPLGKLAAGVPGLAVEGMKARLAKFDTGGYLRPGWTLAYNGTGQMERVLTSQQERSGLGLGGGRGLTIGTVQGYTAREVAAEIFREQDRREALNPVFA